MQDFVRRKQQLGQLEPLRLLLEAGQFEVDATSADGSTAFSLACRNGQDEIARELPSSS